MTEEIHASTETGFRQFPFAVPVHLEDLGGVGQRMWNTKAKWYQPGKHLDVKMAKACRYSHGLLGHGPQLENQRRVFLRGAEPTYRWIPSAHDAPSKVL